MSARKGWDHARSVWYAGPHMALGLEGRGVAVGGDHAEVARAEAERARSETRVLVRLAQVTSGSDAPEDVYEPAFDAARELFGAERSAILLFDDSDRTRFQAWRGLSDAYRSAARGTTLAVWLPRHARRPEA